MSYPVKWFHSDMAGSPTLNAAAGSLIALLKACLIDGFNLKALDSLTYDSGTGEATGTVSAGHGFVLHQVIKVSGADQAAYNGEHRVTYIDSTTFRYAPESAPAATPATTSATLEARAAPVGDWEIAFDDGAGAKAAFRSILPSASGLFFRIDDANTASGWDYSGDPRAFVEGVESMTDIDTYSGVFVDSTYRSIIKDTSTTPTAGGVPWTLVADGTAVYLQTNPSDNADQADASVVALGDIVSYVPGDAYPGFVCLSNDAGTANRCASYFMSLESDAGRRLARAYSQATGQIEHVLAGSPLARYSGFNGLEYPNAADNGLYVHTPVLVTEGTNNDSVVRGYMPGFAQVLHDAPLAHREILTALSGEPALWIAITAGYQVSANNQGQALLDLAGPWR